MAMTIVWTGMVVISLIFGTITGNINAVNEAALEGAKSAIELCLSMAGIICLWSGVMEIMNQAGISGALSRAFRPLLRRLMPKACRDEETLEALSANVSANLLGLGNAATPLGIRAARRMSRHRGDSQRRAVPSCRTQHCLHPADARHHCRRAGCLRLCFPL